MKLRKLLYPFSCLYGVIVYIRRWMYRHRWISSAHFAVPTICVGNLAVGGTGKTPHTEFIIRCLNNKSIALLSRGYRRKTNGCIVAGNLPVEQLNAYTIGDEPMQYVNKFPSLPLAVSENRAIGINFLLKQYPHLQAIILDDAYQHLSVTYSRKILLTEYNNLYINDIPLPAGNLREFPSAAQYADMIIVTKTPFSISHSEKQIIEKQLKINQIQHIFFTTLLYYPLKPISEKAKAMVVSNNTTIILVTAIAHPQSILSHLQTTFSSISLFNYPDHHFFTPKDIAAIKKEYDKIFDKQVVIVTTEKDITRFSMCEKNVLELFPIFTLPVEVGFLFNEEEKFKKIIHSYVRQD